jgi:hypothetical protein
MTRLFIAKDVAAVPGLWLFVGIFNAIMLAAFVFAINQACLVSKSENLKPMTDLYWAC